MVMSEIWNEREFEGKKTWKAEGDHIWYFRNNIQREIWKDLDYESDSDDESEEEKDEK